LRLSLSGLAHRRQNRVVTLIRLIRDPKRLGVIACAIWMIVSMVLAWASAMATRGLVTYQPIASGDAETVLTTVLGLLLIAWAASEGAAGSSSRTIQLAGPAIAIAMAAIMISVEGKARDQVHEWLSVGWSASAETSIAPFTVAAGLVAIALTVWIDLRRPASVRDKTTSFFSEWEITRANIASSSIAIAGAVLGAALGLALGVYLTNGWGYAALLFILLAALGMFIGAKLGTWLGHRVVSTFHLPHLLPLGPRTMHASAQGAALGQLLDEPARPPSNDVWMAPGTRPATPPAADPTLDDAWQRPSNGSALSEDGITAPTIEGADPDMWRRPDGAG
jgi:hypothetical protein